MTGMIITMALISRATIWLPAMLDTSNPKARASSRYKTEKPTMLQTPPESGTSSTYRARRSMVIRFKLLSSR